MSDWLIDEDEEEVGADMAPTSAHDPYSFIDLPHLLVRDEGSWRDNAYCLGQPDLTYIFFKPSMMEIAKEMCACCKVRKECFAFAKNNNLRHGVWGGVNFNIPKRGKKRELPDDVD